MATSMVPTAAPKANRQAASAIVLFAAASKGSNTTPHTPPSIIIGLQPSRALIAPVMGIATTDPIPRLNSSSPSAPSPTPSLALAKGTRGAQQDTPNPA